MDALLDAAETALRRNPAPAVPLGALVRSLRSQGHPVPGASRLGDLLGRAPERFRVLEVWSGPTTTERPSPAPAAPVVGEPEWWVLTLRPERPGDEPPPPVRARWRMRESVRWLGRRVDPRSTRAVSRWYRMVLAEEASRAKLSPPAA